MAMLDQWTKTAKTADEKDRLTNMVKGSKTVFTRLDELIEDELSKLDRSEMDNKTYDNANWAYLQAHKNGSRSAFETVRNLINLDQKDT